MIAYFGRIGTGFWTVIVGMGVTLRHLFRRPVTMQYPEERWRIPPRYRGFHELDTTKCIGCRLCAKACPVDCIYIDVERKGKEVVLLRFAVDYAKCMFCNLCCEPCPTTSLMMGQTFDLSSCDKDDMIVDFVRVGSRSPKAKLSVLRPESILSDSYYGPVEVLTRKELADSSRNADTKADARGTAPEV